MVCGPAVKRRRPYPRGGRVCWPYPAARREVVDLKKGIIALSVLCIVILLVEGLGGLPWSGGRRQTGLELIRVGYHTNYGGSSAMAVGQAQGYFEQEGLQLELVSFNSGPPAIAALMAGDVDVCFLGHGATYFLLEGCADVIAVESLSNAEQILVRADAGVEDMAGLRGMTLATPFGTSGENFAEMVLALYGMDRQDLEMVNYDVAGAVTAFLNGTVDAVSLWAPYTTEILTRASGRAQVLEDCRDFRDQFALPMSWVSTDAFIDADPDRTVRFVRALYRCLDWRAEHPEESARLAAGLLGMGQDELLSSLDTAEWLTSESAALYLQDGRMEQWYAAQHRFFEDKEGSGGSVPMEDYMRFEILRAVLLGQEEEGTCSSC